MAGAGYKLFNTGDVLTAAQVNTYLNEQTVMVFASSAARTSALSGVLAEGMVSYLQDTNAVEVYNGSAWVGVSGAGDVTEVQAGTGISVASGTGPIPVVTNTMATAVDAKGDLIVGTGADTFARLAVGTNGHTLVADSSVSPTGLKWAAPSSGALTLLSRNSFSAVTSVSLTGVISASYDAYLVSVEKIFYAGSGTRNLLLSLLYSTSTEQTSDYYFGTVQIAATNTNTSGGPSSSWNLSTNISSNTNQAGHFFAYLSQVNNQGAPQFSGHGMPGDAITPQLAGGLNTTSRSYTGIKITSSTGSNIAGTVAIYGLGI